MYPRAVQHFNVCIHTAGKKQYVRTYNVLIVKSVHGKCCSSCYKQLRLQQLLQTAQTAAAATNNSDCSSCYKQLRLQQLLQTTKTAAAATNNSDCSSCYKQLRLQQLLQTTQTAAAATNSSDCSCYKQLRLQQLLQTAQTAARITPLADVTETLSTASDRPHMQGTGVLKDCTCQQRCVCRCG